MKKTLFPTLLFLLVTTTLAAQQIHCSFPYTYITEFKTIDHDSLYVMILDSNLKYEAKTNPTPMEYFTPSDTAYRSCFVSGGHIYMIDSLACRDYRNYSMNDQIVGIYKTQIHKEKFLIIDYYNGYQFGTFVQPTFFIFKEEKGDYVLQSVYLVGNVNGYDSVVSESLRMYYKKGKIRMEGINLVLLRDPDWLESTEVITLQNATINGVPAKTTFDSLTAILGLPDSKYESECCGEILRYWKNELTYNRCGDTVHLQDIYFPKNPEVNIVYKGVNINGRMTANKFCRKFHVRKEHVFPYLSVNTGCPVDNFDEHVVFFCIWMHNSASESFSEWVFDKNRKLVFAAFYQYCH